MDEKNLITILEALANEIDRLHSDIDMLKYEKKKLAQELELYKEPKTIDKESRG
jgi:hypothetical protein